MATGKEHLALANNIRELNYRETQTEGRFEAMLGRLANNGVSDENIGKISLLDYQQHGGKNHPVRDHFLLAIDDNEVRDVAWYSPASPAMTDSSGALIVAKPGLGEIVEGGIGKRFHTELSNRNPHNAILSHATEGFGPHAQPTIISEQLSHGLQRMADHGREILKAYFSNTSIILVGTSMGTNINHRVIQGNKQALTVVKEFPDAVLETTHHKAAKGTLDIVGNINFAPALVPRERIFIDMAMRFPYRMAKDGINEIALKTKPQHLRDAFKVMADSRFKPKDALPMLRHIFDLLTGVDKAEVIANTQAVPTSTIVGELDPVGQIPMWQETEADLKIVPRRGHGMAIKPVDGARAVTKELNRKYL